MPEGELRAFFCEEKNFSSSRNPAYWIYKKNKKGDKNMSCTICGYGFPIADGDAVTLDFKKACRVIRSDG